MRLPHGLKLRPIAFVRRPTILEAPTQHCEHCCFPIQCKNPELRVGHFATIYLFPGHCRHSPDHQSRFCCGSSGSLASLLAFPTNSRTMCPGQNGTPSQGCLWLQADHLELSRPFDDNSAKVVGLPGFEPAKFPNSPDQHATPRRLRVRPNQFTALPQVFLAAAKKIPCSGE